MGAQRLDDLVADADHRMQRRARVLEDHGDLGAAQRAHRPFVDGDEIGAVEARRSVERRVAKQSHQRQRDRRLAATALADEPQRLPLFDLEGDAVDRSHRPEGDGKVFHLEERRHGGEPATRSRILGSSASRRPSPIKLKLVTASVIASPGRIASIGSTWKSLWALVSMLPQLAAGG